MNFEWPLFSTVIPHLGLLATACLALLADLFFGKRYKSIAYTIVQMGLVVSVSMTIAHFNAPTAASFSGLVIDDKVARLLEIFIQIIAFFAFLYWSLLLHIRQFLLALNISRFSRWE